MTTILTVRKNNSVVIGGDGQATIGYNIIKNNVCKIKKIYNNTIISGFSGSISDSFTLLDLLEKNRILSRKFIKIFNRIIKRLKNG